MRNATGSKRKIAPTYDAGSLSHMASTAQPKKPVKQPKGRGKGRKGNGKTADANELSDAEAGSERESDGGSDNGTMASTTRVSEILESLADDEDLRDVAQAHCQFNQKSWRQVPSQVESGDVPFRDKAWTSHPRGAV